VIENALLYTLESGVHTADFGDRAIPAVNTTAFAQKIIENFGQTPRQGAKPVLPNQPITPTHFQLDKNPLIMTQEMQEETIVGVDFFVESADQPTVVAEKALQHTGNLFQLVTISNRGTQVWPKGSIYTNIVNQYRCRFESKDNVARTQLEILELYKALQQDFKICSLELLNMWGNQKAYSLAQGQ
ncbi:MAG: isocitrate dehydrogenase, partial [Chitinophagaceae bacterium]